MRAAAAAVSASVIAVPSDRTALKPGTTGTPCAATCSFARILSPITSSARSPGPMKTMPASAQARANSAFSERKP